MANVNFREVSERGKRLQRGDRNAPTPAADVPAASLSLEALHHRLEKGLHFIVGHLLAPQPDSDARLEKALAHWISLSERHDLMAGRPPGWKLDELMLCNAWAVGSAPLPVRLDATGKLGHWQPVGDAPSPLLLPCSLRLADGAVHVVARRDEAEDPARTWDLWDLLTLFRTHREFFGEVAAEKRPAPKRLTAEQRHQLQEQLQVSLFAEFKPEHAHVSEGD